MHITCLDQWVSQKRQNRVPSWVTSTFLSTHQHLQQPFLELLRVTCFKMGMSHRDESDAELSSPSHFYGQFAFCEQKQTGVCPSGCRCWHWFPLVPLEWMFWGDFFWPVFFTQGFTNYFWSLMIIEKLHWSKSPSILFCPRGSCGYLDKSVSLCPLVTSLSWSLMDTNTGNITCGTQTFPGI